MQPPWYAISWEIGIIVERLPHGRSDARRVRDTLLFHLLTGAFGKPQPFDKLPLYPIVHVDCCLMEQMGEHERRKVSVLSRNLGDYSGSSLHGIVDSRARRTFEILRDEIHADSGRRYVN